MNLIKKEGLPYISTMYCPPTTVVLLVSTGLIHVYHSAPPHELEGKSPHVRGSALEGKIRSEDTLAELFCYLLAASCILITHVLEYLLLAGAWLPSSQVLKRW